MAKLESLGIRKIESLLYYVEDLERVRRFFLDKLDFAEIGVSSPELETEGRQKSAVFQAGARHDRHLPARRRGRPRLALAAQAPRGRRHDRLRGRGHRQDLQAARRARRHHDHRRAALRATTAARWRCSASPRRSATPPSASSSARAIEPLFPGLVVHAKPIGGNNRFGFKTVDHVTTNFQTMAPALLWMEHVLGFERFWTVQFHTSDVRQGGAWRARG